MHSAVRPARNPANLYPGEEPGDSLMSIVADMVALMTRVQASARLIEAAIQRDVDGGDGNETADVVILDDLTPCYAAASETLNACNAGLALRCNRCSAPCRRQKGPRSGGSCAHTNPRERSLHPCP